MTILSKENERHKREVAIEEKERMKEEKEGKRKKRRKVYSSKLLVLIFLKFKC